MAVYKFKPTSQAELNQLVSLVDGLRSFTDCPPPKHYFGIGVGIVVCHASDGWWLFAQDMVSIQLARVNDFTKLFKLN